MKSASALSMEIRAKKKAMQSDPSVIDSGGSPSMDLQDEELMERNAMTKQLGLDKNEPNEQDNENEQPEQELSQEHDPAPEKEDPLDGDTEMLADGGEVDLENTEEVENKALARASAEEPKPMDEAKSKRMARLRLKM